MIDHLALAIVLSFASDGPQSLERPASVASVVESDLVVRYRFVNPMFDISRIEMSIDGAGRGRLTWERRDVAKPQSREIHVSEQGIQEIRSRLDLLNFVNSTEVYQTKPGHVNLGATNIRVDQNGVGREVEFNYTKNRDADALGRLLRGIANREMYVADLEVAVVHQPLDTPAVMATIMREFKNGRIGDAAALVPMLRRIADDMALPLIARNKAAEFVQLIEKDRKRER